jgi:hypothetical protein
MESRMNVPARTFIFAAILVTGCGTTRDVAVTSYHVTRDAAVGSYRIATAPAHYVMRRHGDQSSATTTASDVTTPGQPVPSPELASASRQQSRPESNRVSSPSSSVAPRMSRQEITQAKPKPPSSHASSPQAEFPTAKSVPGKPGYVVSPFDSSGRYVDVSGYVSGSKVKDPWTDKIFIVP